MPLIQAPKNPGALRETGDALLQAASAIDAKPLKARLAAFAAAHRAFVAAHLAVMKAEERHGEAVAVVAERDLDQDDAVDALASALAGDGFRRQNPFAELEAASPSKVKALGYGAEAVVVRKLAARVKSADKASKRSKALAAALDRAGAAVLAALTPVAKLESERALAIARRDPLALAWRTAFSALKRGAKAAEDDGARGLTAALFDRPAAPKRKKAATATPPTE